MVKRKKILLLILLSLFVLIGVGIWKRRALQESLWMISLRSSTTSLPRCNRVEIYHLDPNIYDDELSTGFPIRPYEKFARILEHRTLKGEDAEEFAELWRSQRFAENPSQYQAMCHDPAFGLRFYKGPVLRFETSVCFDCGNFTLTAWGESDFWGFDDLTPEGVKLLERLLELFPSTATPQEKRHLELTRKILLKMEHRPDAMEDFE
jgi:hypothetical protein